MEKASIPSIQNMPGIQSMPQHILASLKMQNAAEFSGLFGEPDAATEKAPSAICVAYVDSIGWMPPARRGETAGTVDRGLRMEALKIFLDGAVPGSRIRYRVHVQNLGWQNWVYDGETGGTTGFGLRAEAVQIKLEDMPGFRVKYRAKVENVGWQNWVTDSETAGTTGEARRMEAVEIILEKI